MPHETAARVLREPAGCGMPQPDGMPQPWTLPDLIAALRRGPSGSRITTPRLENLPLDSQPGDHADRRALPLLLAL